MSDHLKINTELSVMNLTKREYIALEVFKHKDVSVKQAWLVAGDFLEISREMQSNANIEETAIEDVEEPIIKVDYESLFWNVIPQGMHELEVGQRWFNWFRGEELIIEPSCLEAGDYPINTIAPSVDKTRNEQFLCNGWQWELMLEGENAVECRGRLFNERERLSKLDEFQETAVGGFIYKDKNTLDITVRSSNFLLSEGVRTYEDLLKTTYIDLLKTKSSNRKSLAEIMEKLSEKGLYLGMLKTNN